MPIFNSDMRVIDLASFGAELCNISSGQQTEQGAYNSLWSPLPLFFFRLSFGKDKSK